MPGPHLSPFARRLREYREAAGLSLAQLGQRVQLSKAYLWQLETGRRPAPSWEVVCRIAAALGRRTDAFRE